MSRGKSPKYSEERKYPVFAQKCNQWEGITLEKVQFLEPSTLQKWPDEYKLQDGDVLINSTGTGTHITPIILEVEEPPPQTALLERYTVNTAEDTFKGKLASSRDKDELKDIINQ